MLTIAKKELMELLYSPKYLFIFIGALIIIGFAFVNGYSNYSEELDRAVAMETRYRDDVAESLSFGGFGVGLARKPSVLSIIDSGVTYAIGIRGSVGISLSARFMNATPNVELISSRYSDNPALALFKELDITQTVMFIFSLIAILLSHSAICGEKENGTLKLIHSNSISRASVLFGKALGGLIPLLIAFLVPFLLSILILTSITGISFNNSEWLSISLLLLAYTLYITFFYFVGLVASVFTKTSFISFLAALLVWVTLIIIVPRMSVEVAEMLQPTTPKEVKDNDIRILASDIRREFSRKEAVAVNEAHITKAEYEERKQEFSGIFSEQRKTKIDQETKRITDEYSRKRTENLVVLEQLSRLSPASLLKFTTGRIAGTDHSILKSFDESVQAYIPGFREKAQIEHNKIADEAAYFWQHRQKIVEEKDAQGYVKVTVVGDPNLTKPSGNIDSIPHFTYNNIDPIGTFEQSIIDFTILLFASILLFAISFIGYLRFDVR